MNCKHCGFSYSASTEGELVCYHCLLESLEKQIANIKTTINGYDFPKTHSELTRGTFEGVTNLAAELANFKHDLDLLTQNFNKLYNHVNET